MSALQLVDVILDLDRLVCGAGNKLMPEKIKKSVSYGQLSLWRTSILHVQEPTYVLRIKSQATLKIPTKNDKLLHQM